MNNAPLIILWLVLLVGMVTTVAYIIEKAFGRDDICPPKTPYGFIKRKKRK